MVATFPPLELVQRKAFKWQWDCDIQDLKGKMTTEELWQVIGKV